MLLKYYLDVIFENTFFVGNTVTLCLEVYINWAALHIKCK